MKGSQCEKSIMNFVQGENEVKVATLVVSLCTMDNELMKRIFTNHDIGFK
jgi:hypothetical protein